MDVTPANFDACKRQILAVEQERYGAATAPAAEARPAGGRRCSFRSTRSKRPWPIRARSAWPSATACRGDISPTRSGSALENHDEEGVGSDPHFGENNTFYLHAAATLPAVQNAAEIENFLLESLRERVVAAGFEYLSSLIEEKLVETGPPWLRRAAILDRIDNYLGSGMQFVYLHAALK